MQDNNSYAFDISHEGDIGTITIAGSVLTVYNIKALLEYQHSPYQTSPIILESPCMPGAGCTVSLIQNQTTLLYIAQGELNPIYIDIECDYRSNLIFGHTSLSGEITIACMLYEYTVISLSFKTYSRSSYS